MPTYSYACTVCGHRFDAQQSFSDAALAECPECGGRLRKLFGNVGVVFKGPGFYRTDARAGANGKAAKDASSNGAPTPPTTPAPASTPGSSGTGSSSTGSSGTGSSATSSAAASA